MCRYCHQNPKVKMTPLKPERWKTLLAFLYVLLVSWVTAFVMVIVHDRVPDMEKYPPLPDIILDNVPHIPWVSFFRQNTTFFQNSAPNVARAGNEICAHQIFCENVGL